MKNFIYIVSIIMLLMLCGCWQSENDLIPDHITTSPFFSEYIYFKYDNDQFIVKRVASKESGNDKKISYYDEASKSYYKFYKINDYSVIPGSVKYIVSQCISIGDVNLTHYALIYKYNFQNQWYLISSIKDGNEKIATFDDLKEKIIFSLRNGVGNDKNIKNEKVELRVPLDDEVDLHYRNFKK